MDLAAATGISQSQISKQLRGNRAIDLDELQVICKALNVPMETVISIASEDLTSNNVVQLPQRSNIPPAHVGPVPYGAVADHSPDEDALREAEEGDME